MKKQINELLPLKNKTISLENQIAKLETELRYAKDRLGTFHQQITANHSLLSQERDTVNSLKNCSMNLENKLCDIKHYVVNNFPEDKVAEFFKEYTI
jgi:hypothetical protein